MKFPLFLPEGIIAENNHNFEGPTIASLPFDKNE
jgi:hypothetical protein